MGLVRHRRPGRPDGRRGGGGASAGVRDHHQRVDRDDTVRGRDDRVQVDLEDVVAGDEQLAHGHAELGARVQVDAAPGLPDIEGDAVHLELALLNLVTNAIDAMGDGGALSVSLAPRGSGVRLEVGDSGPGVPESLIAQIFDPWVTTKPYGRGTGLGLAIARSVIGAHGGTISVANRPTGGAVFTVDLPVAADVATAPAAPVESAASRPVGSR